MSDAPVGGITIANGRVLLANGVVERLPVRIEAAEIAGFADGPADEAWLDCGDALVLPGLVDVHGDSFERHMMPRPGADFPLDVALLDNDRALAANGITTAYLGVGCSWEPGIRGTDSAVTTIAGLTRLRDELAVDTRVHLRFEIFNVDGAEPAVAMLQAGLVHLVAFNDHLGQYERRIADEPHRLDHWARQAGLTIAEFAALLRRVRAREAEAPAALDRVLQASRQAGVPLASHDDESPADRDRWQARGVSIAEFPCDRPTAAHARRLGNPVVMGAPNVVRGGSQDGNVSAGAMVAEGHCTVLASDYYYPAPLHAAFRMHREGLPLGDAWALVSSSAAAAVGLHDRGAIVPGARADLVVVDDRARAPRVLATVAAGRLAFCSDRPWRPRTGQAAPAFPASLTGATP
jgi:alpha-D-ribose 1-methylphosphonate 5-triphosphate diphosphatase